MNVNGHSHGHGHGHGHCHCHKLFIWMMKIDYGPASNLVQATIAASILNHLA
jgi:hypothetical protein